MNASAYWNVIRRRYVPLVVVFAVIGAVFGVVTQLGSTREYVATARILASSQRADSVLVSQSTTLATQRMRTYVRLADSTELAQRLVDSLGLDDSPRELASRISAELDRDTTVMKVAVVAPTPEEAEELARAIPTEFTSLVGDLTDSPEGADEETRFAIFDGPVVGSNSSPIRFAASVALGVAVWGSLGLALAFMLSRKAVTGSPEVLVHQTGLPVVAMVPESPKFEGRDLARRKPWMSRSAAYDRLATNLGLVTQRSGRAVLVTGVAHHAGSSSIALGLAIALAERGERVLLVDASFERGCLSKRLACRPADSLADVMAGSAALDSAVVSVANHPGLSLVTVSPNSERLAGPAQRRALHQSLSGLIADFDTTVVDAPPVLLHSDQPTPWSLADAALLIVRHGQRSRTQAGAAAAVLRMNGVPSAGVVVNRLAAGTVSDEQLLSGLALPSASV